MKTRAKKTRNCVEPWRSFQFEAQGNISPCCSGTITGDFGNINRYRFDEILAGEESDIFANTAYRELREGLLTGELLPSCRSCRSVHDEDVSTEELRQRVVNHLESHGVQGEGVDLTTSYAFHECGGNVTNKCNFSCLYCSHSGADGHSGYLLAEMEQKRFQDLINFLCRKGLKIFNFCGIGEITIYPGWRQLCESLLQKHPQLRLRMISNFGRRFQESELDILSRFDLIHVSCDTLDAETYAWLRKAGSLPVLLDNIARLRAKFTGDPARDPRLVFNVTVTDVILERLEELFRFAADHSMFIHLSSLFVMHGSIASETDCVRKITDAEDGEMPRIREILFDLPRRLKAQNPLTGVWEYKFLYKKVQQRADALTWNQFVPGEQEAVYRSFYRSHPKEEHAHLRKIWLSFDECLKGIYVSAGSTIEVELSPDPVLLAYRAIWCRDRLDGNLDVIPGPVREVTVAGKLTVSAANCGDSYHKMLFEVLSCHGSEEPATAVSVVAPEPPAEAGKPLLVREAFLMDEEELLARRLVQSQEPIVIWCAGLRTLQMLSHTCLGEANIRMIIDGNRARKGEPFCGRIIHSPEDLGDFDGRIVVIHASCPEQVESELRRQGGDQRSGHSLTVHQLRLLTHFEP